MFSYSQRYSIHYLYIYKYIARIFDSIDEWGYCMDSMFNSEIFKVKHSDSETIHSYA